MVTKQQLPSLRQAVSGVELETSEGEEVVGDPGAHPEPGAEVEGRKRKREASVMS